MKAPGFSMMEMIVVVAIVAIIALMAGPAISRLVPVQRLRGEAQNMGTFMRQARLKAASNQKPVRVSLECPGERGLNPQPPCRLAMTMARYDGNGEVVDWDPVPNFGHELTRQVFAIIPDSTALKDDSGGKTPEPDRMFWMIFMPSGRAFSWPRPFSLAFYADDLRGAGGSARRPGWLMEVDNNSGRVSLNPCSEKAKCPTPTSS